MSPVCISWLKKIDLQFYKVTVSVALKPHCTSINMYKLQVAFNNIKMHTWDIFYFVIRRSSGPVSGYSKSADNLLWKRFLNNRQCLLHSRDLSASIFVFWTRLINISQVIFRYDSTPVPIHRLKLKSLHLVLKKTIQKGKPSLSDKVVH